MTMFNYAQSNSLLKREIEEKDNDQKRSNGISSNDVATAPPQIIGALAPVNADAMGIPTSDTGTTASSGKRKEKVIPAKKSQHTKRKITNNNTDDSGMTENSNDTNASDAKDSAENKIKKLRIRKPRRIIPNEKGYIPENEQPTQSDVVGGRGGEFSE